SGLGSEADREQIAKRVSPLTYVRAGLPPILTIHGDADPTVPYTQSVRLHKALSDVSVPNELLTMPGGKHGYDCCTPPQRLQAYAKIREFLTRHHVLEASTPPTAKEHGHVAPERSGELEMCERHDVVAHDRVLALGPRRHDRGLDAGDFFEPCDVGARRLRQPIERADAGRRLAPSRHRLADRPGPRGAAPVGGEISGRVVARRGGARDSGPGSAQRGGGVLPARRGAPPLRRTIRSGAAGP